MSNRKESLKKSLGITEYPWSSDDEEGPALQENPDESLLQRQVPESQPADEDLPGTSGEPPPQPSPSSGPTQSPRNRTMAQVQAKRDRDAFWTYLNNQTSSLFNHTRPVTHTPAPDLIERPQATSPCLDIQRILALKRLARNCNQRPRIRPNTTFYAVPATRPNYPYRTPTFTSPPSGHRAGNVPTRSSRMFTAFKRSRTFMNNPYSTVSGILMPLNRPLPSTGGLTHGDVRRVNNLDDEQLADHIPQDNTADNSQSDDDVELPHPSTSAAGDNNDNDAEQESNENMEGIAQNTADGAISLEEEIVEMDAAEVTIVDRQAGMDEEAQNDDETQEVLTVIRDMEEISNRNPDEPVNPQVVQPQGLKRKRGTADITIPYTVKDFNQGLLRLLECPVCLEWMEPPIAQCRRGHLVCARCRGRLAACPVCRTMFSSVRNRAMEGVAEMLRYPCRHGCGREVRLRRRAPHEASCASRKYYCPAPACMHRNPLPREQLATHFQGKHLSMLKIGSMHNFTIKINAEVSDDWLIMTLDELFHLRVDVDVRSWGVIVYVAYIGPKCNATKYMYEVTVEGHRKARRLNYTRATHSDLDLSSMNMNRHDCFNLTLDQALNFLRFNNRNCDSERFLDFSVEVKKCTQPVDVNEDMDS